ncbi:unnamed protein product [Psylliodes chrysocephalus]|uniref:endo-polygalacturonase n=1 Tax=Psylliodes chrysocephalus TaxID=3402493 RepID=A0A9P0CPN6_9CUCU|nr:unnamed protein product [Psylliodes chrysocephala]
MNAYNIILFTVLATLGSFSCSQNLDCIVSQFSQLKSVIRSCKYIIVSNLTVPAKTTLELNLLSGTSLVFEGRTTFEYAEWPGPLVKIHGDNVTIKGAPDSVLDGQGALYWDGQGGNGGKRKPKFIRIIATNSNFEKINLINCPVHCVTISHSNNITIRHWNIDVSDGDKNNFTGHNTDGFDVTRVQNAVIDNCTVQNQDDCIAINKGSNIRVSNMYCSGGHGLSLSVGTSNTHFKENVVTNVTFIDSIVHRSANGIHLKTHVDSGLGLISNILYDNIHLTDITNFGINVQQDYSNGSSTGVPKGNIPIVNFTLNNISGNMKSFRESPTLAVKILCGQDGCSDWTWNDVVITDARNASYCNYEPVGFSCK